jgi:tellurite resistance protein/uncharacterized protein (DUF697 family)
VHISTENRPEESEAMIAIAVLAALSDSGKSDPERECIAALAHELGYSDAPSVSRKVLVGKMTLESAIAALGGQNSKQLAYEMALSVCEASGGVSPEERGFLNQLKSRLGLDPAGSSEVEKEVCDVLVTPQPFQNGIPGSTPETIRVEAGAGNSGMILKYAILNAALELLPESMATMAIVPLQVKMVYRIGRSHGVSLDSGHVREFLAAAGIGMGSQMLEGFARKLLGGLGKSMAGKAGRRIGSQSAGSAMSFASTYAIGMLADRYYAEGRKLNLSSLKSLYEPLREKAQQMHATYLPEIREKSRHLDVGSVLNLVRGNQQP